jgi:hypothetical protein
MPRKGITVYLSPDIEAKVTRLAVDQHRSESSVIAEAVRMRLSARGSEAPPETLLPRLTGRVDAGFEKSIGELLTLKEVLLSFILLWLQHTPQIDEALEDAAADSAEARFQQFLKFVHEGLEGRSLAQWRSEAEPDLGQ